MSKTEENIYNKCIDEIKNSFYRSSNGDRKNPPSIIGLGESTHGTSDFFKFKSKVVERLVREGHVRTVLLESNFPESLLLDRFVRGENISLQNALDSIYFWTWDTKQVASILRWMREFNEKLSGNETPVRVFGVDVQFLRGPAQHILDALVETEADLPQTVVDTLEEIATDGVDHSIKSNAEDSQLLQEASVVADVLRNLFKEQSTSLSESLTDEQWKLLQRHRKVFTYAVRHHRADTVTEQLAVREAGMADTAEWIAQQMAPAGCILWSHNMHVKKVEMSGGWGSTPSTGTRLAENVDYYAIGLEFAEGRFRALPVDWNRRPEDVRVFKRCLKSAPEGVQEIANSQSGDSLVSAIDCRRESVSLPPDWIQTPHRFTQIGAVYFDEEQRNESVYTPESAFDTLLFFSDTSATEPFFGGN